MLPPSLRDTGANEANEDKEVNYQELIHELSFDLFSFLSARVSYNFAEEESIKDQFLKPIFENFNTSSWDSVSWTKFVIILMVCNGGSNETMNIDEYEDTVQDRLMKLVTDQQVFTDVTKAERIIDFQMLDVLVEAISTKINEDIEK